MNDLTQEKDFDKEEVKPEKYLILYSSYHLHSQKSSDVRTVNMHG